MLATVAIAFFTTTFTLAARAILFATFVDSAILFAATSLFGIF